MVHPKQRPVQDDLEGYPLDKFALIEARRIISRLGFSLDGEPASLLTVGLLEQPSHLRASSFGSDLLNFPKEK